MKVLHVIPSVSLARGGTSQAVLELLQALRSQNLDVNLVTTNDDGENLLTVPLGQKTEYQQIPTWFFPRWSAGGAAIREFTFSRELTAWLWHHIADYDLVHVHALFSYPSTAAMTIARIQKVPYINQPHGLLCEWSLQQSQLKKQLYLALVERMNLNHSQALQLTSEMEYQEVNRLRLKTKGMILPIGLSVAAPIPQARQQLREKLNLPSNQPIILFMSRLHHKKGLEYLIPALSKLSDRPFTFVLAGSGTPEYEAEIDQQLIDAGIHDRTYRPGFVIGEFKDLILQGSDIFALTSYSENFGVVVLEAMAAGLATVLTPGVALAEILKTHQIGYVPALEVVEIANTLRNCLDQLPETKMIGDRARQYILEHYTWNQIATKLTQTYAQLLNQKSLAAIEDGYA